MQVFVHPFLLTWLLLLLALKDLLRVDLLREKERSQKRKERRR